MIVLTDTKERERFYKENPGGSNGRISYEMTIPNGKDLATGKPWFTMEGHDPGKRWDEALVLDPLDCDFSYGSYVGWWHRTAEGLWSHETTTYRLQEGNATVESVLDANGEVRFHRQLKSPDESCLQQEETTVRCRYIVEAVEGRPLDVDRKEFVEFFKYYYNA